MSSIVRISKGEGIYEYVYNIFPTITTTDKKHLALRMDFQQAVRTSLTLGDAGIGNCIITKKNWEE